MIKFQSLPYIPLRITSGYGDRTEQVSHIKNATKWHSGVDIGRDFSKYPADNGNAGNVLAVMDGEVVEVGYNNARGNFVILEHERENGKKVETLYQHLHSTISQSHGKVKAGEPIGIMGFTGVGSGTHLHFELRINGKPIDPTRHLYVVEHEQAKPILPPDVLRLAEKVKNALPVEQQSIDFLSTHKIPHEVFRKILAGEDLSPRTNDWIRNDYMHGEALYQRIEEYKKKVRAGK